jgi:hypothetical protein
MHRRPRPRERRTVMTRQRTGLLPEELVIDGDDDDNVKLNQNLISNVTIVF